MFREGESRLHSSTALRVAAAMSIPLAVGATERGCTDLVPQSAPSPAYTYEYPAYYDLECDPITDAEIEATEDVYADTWRPLPPVSGEGGPVFSSIEAERQQLRLDVAAELGLTVYDYNAEFADLQSDLYADESVIPVEEYFERAKEFLARYGVTLTLEPKRRDDDMELSTPISYEQMVAENSKEFKQTLYGFIKGLGDLPVEMVEYTGLRRLVLADITYQTASGSEVAGFAITDVEAPDTIYVDPALPGGFVLVHEMTHLWDANQCGPAGMFRDEQFGALNPVKPDQFSFYDNTTGYYSSRSAFAEKSSQNLYTQIQLATTDEERAAIQQQIDAIDALIVSPVDYGMTNIVEDKATIGEVLFGFYSRQNIEAIESPILQEKTMFLAARMYQDMPAVVEYLARAGLGSFHTTNVLAD